MCLQLRFTCSHGRAMNRLCIRRLRVRIGRGIASQWTSRWPPTLPNALDFSCTNSSKFGDKWGIHNLYTSSCVHINLIRLYTHVWMKRCFDLFHRSYLEKVCFAQDRETAGIQQLLIFSRHLTCILYSLRTCEHWRTLAYVLELLASFAESNRKVCVCHFSQRLS